jgi:penicillin-binding protein 1A
VLTLSSFTFGLVTAIASRIPELDPARQQRQEVNGYIYDSKGKRILAVLRGSENRVIVESEDIADVMKHAIVAIEDRRFFEHRGVDLHGILRAVWADIRHKKIVEGGSTITQQLIKNTYLRNQRSFGRKLKEAALAWQLERRHGKRSKDWILTAYLNTIYFGNGAYGIQQAAKVYFDHGAKYLTLPEAALLAGIPADPSQYDPVTNPRAARARRNLVLRNMLEFGDISPADYRSAARAPLPRPEDVRLPGTHGPAQYFTNYVKQQLVSTYRSGKVFGGGFRVRTTINLDLQKIGRDAISKWLNDQNGPSAALVAIRPKDGAVLAMIGGRNYRESQFNLAVQGERQPGSSFKPFVLAAALNQGVSPATTFVSKPVDIPLGDRIWPVRNYENSDLGPITVATATTVSDNSVYAQLTWLVTPRNVKTMAHRLGITSRLNDYFAIGLGAEAVNPLEMARAFSSFANGGRRVDGSLIGNHPRVIESVVYRGKEQRNRPVPKQALSEENAGILTSMLQRVVTSGTGKRAALPDGRAIAGKTGTTENYGDAWFVGYTPQLAAAVWVGYPNRLRPMLTEFHGAAVAGGTYPALIWKSFMERALAKQPHESFPSAAIPYGVPRRVALRTNRWLLDNGYCKVTREVVYFAAHVPQRQAGCKPNEVEVPRVVGESLEAARAHLEAQPLKPVYAYMPALPRQRLGIVVRQYPKGGTLSSFDEVTLWLPRALHGIVPDVVGLKVTRAREKLSRLKLEPKIVFTVGRPAGKVVRQVPRASVAAAPGMPVKLLVGRG